MTPTAAQVEGGCAEFERALKSIFDKFKVRFLQAEFSTTQVLDRPLHGCVFFEQMIRENLAKAPAAGEPTQQRGGACSRKAEPRS